MKTHYLLLTLLVFFHSSAQGQIIDKIEKASDSHSSSSSSSESSGSSSSGSSGGSFEAGVDIVDGIFGILSIFGDSDDGVDEETEEYYEEEEPYESYSAPAPSPQYDTEPTESLDYTAFDFNPNIYLNLSYRRTVDARDIIISIPEAQLTVGNFYMSMRVNQLIEPQVKAEDRFSTVDIQFLGFQTNPLAPVVFNLSTGLLAESTGNSYGEWVAGLRVRLEKRVYIFGEGRLSQNRGVRIRSEGTLGAEGIILKKEKMSLSTIGFFTSALYYETVPVEGFGFGLTARF